MYTDLFRRSSVATVLWRLDDPEDLSSLRLVDANPAASQAVGVDLDDRIGDPPEAFEPADLWRPLLESVDDVLARDEAVDLGEFDVVGAEGEIRTLGAAAFRVNVDTIGTVFADLTERLGVERELEQARRFETFGQLAAGIAHELNTPAQYVSDNLVYLQRTWDQMEKMARNGDMDELGRRFEAITAEVPEVLAECREGVDRIADIVRGMRQLSHPGTEHPVPSDLNQVVRNAVTVSRNEWRYVAELELDLDPELPPVPCVVGDLGQVLVNLIVNSAQALAETDERGRIRVSTMLEDGVARIRIADDGPGIPEDIADRVFDPFFTTKDVGQGSGQGLAIARAIVEQGHDGRLRLEAGEPPGDEGSGSGAVFTVDLPLEHAPPSTELFR